MGQEGSFHLSTKSRGEESRAYLGNGTLWGVYKEAGTVRPEGATPRKGCGEFKGDATIRSASSTAGDKGVVEMRRGWGREASGEAMTSPIRECPWTEKRTMGSQKDEETRIHGNLETGWMQRTGRGGPEEGISVVQEQVRPWW